MLAKHGFQMVNPKPVLYDKSVNKVEIKRGIARKLDYVCPGCGRTNTIELHKGYTLEEVQAALAGNSRMANTCPFCRGHTNVSESLIELLAEERAAVEQEDQVTAGRIVLPEGLEPLGGRKD